MGNDSAPKLVVIAGLTTVLFFFGVLVLQGIPEIPVDIDQKPFFIPFLLVALLPLGAPAFAVGLGAALGEGFGDILEGYEVDDLPGFVGYVLCFVIAAYIIGNRPRNWALVSLACLVGAFVQSAIEAATLLIFGGEALPVAVVSGAGNTVTHGILGGVIPTLILIPLLHGRIERFMGYAPKGAEKGEGAEAAPERA